LKPSLPLSRLERVIFRAPMAYTPTVYYAHTFPRSLRLKRKFPLTVL
jgi:hypothetical protein